MKCCKVLPKGAPLCVHSCIELISKSEKNPGRAFWNCPEHGFSHFVDIREDKNAATVTKKRKILGTGSNSSNSSSSTSTLVVDIDTVLLAAQKYAIAAGSASQAVEELVVENRRLKAEIVQLRAKIAAMESE
ncbi:hypothetical protein HDU82_007885 [Entophlyctis luteolus]|nr:hypothetical protein HDU82_007885 [Entophlyctis luteolus]KAJ3393415.1 hypothetical protein HDU84_001905 [Entophlyctis sp. JEL0112]